MPSSVANIVATQSFVGQTVSLASTAIYTPAAAGLFRVNIYVEKTGTGNLNPVVTWTDDYSASSKGFTGLPFEISTFTVRSAAASAISVAAPISSGTPTFSVYVVIEQLA